ncbi:gliding motility lipoprotein GldD [Zhouia spongiae]|uniref:Gliding motility lipoprotein GldD n=1 Tax=Zhouia spongiae TaxID=2202721 RepID=A0ABY3YNZ6_9FLAO|nr:gliding motility lipoprotein GldD [Zhouia spongiae]UNY99541.1 gliding motility lipoprotein GldD [Zhouia spongiae]
MKVIKVFFIFLLVAAVVVSCKEEAMPKPEAALRLDYPLPVYINTVLGGCPFSMEINKAAVADQKGNCAYNVNYSSMNATVFLTYKEVDGNIDSLLMDAQKLTYEHAVKADGIIDQPFINDDENVYGMFYRISGDAASQSQFYVTDSVRHFLTGSLYFKTKPNYDSILPAAAYLENDIRKMMESVRWIDKEVK